jgi:hypothetical protein
MGQIPEGRKPLTWKDMTSKHSSWEAECAALRARVAKLEAVLLGMVGGKVYVATRGWVETSESRAARAVLGDDR